MDTKINNWIKELSRPNAQQPSISESQEHERRITNSFAQNEAALQLGDQIYRASRAPKIPPDSFEAVIKCLLDQTDSTQIQEQILYKINLYSLAQKSTNNPLKAILPKSKKQVLLNENKQYQPLGSGVFSQDAYWRINYSSKNEAIQDCRSHLISKRFMQKFVSQLNGKGCKTPLLDFQISCFFKKMKRVFGLLRDCIREIMQIFDDNLLNKGQVFSIYTYIISKLQYLICNLQGVGSVLTDPIIHTHEGNFGETDLDMDGLSEYVISVERFRETRYQKYLDMLDVKY
ncbi:unnamed protein product [Paramecium octaurelia]|uniref:Alpha-type protein kinase domain-containing protein n=1 Tax=Paramecium octaurelia TaxID=43137 RepID=A0A8S1YJK1_PAROT|nr:unnamed protein product [Paramecium octaurelia]